MCSKCLEIDEDVGRPRMDRAGLHNFVHKECEANTPKKQGCNRRVQNSMKPLIYKFKRIGLQKSLLSPSSRPIKLFIYNIPFIIDNVDAFFL